MDWLYESYIDEARWQPTTIWELSVVICQMTDFLSDLNIIPLRTYAHIFKKLRKKVQLHMCLGTHIHTQLTNTTDLSWFYSEPKHQFVLNLSFSPSFINKRHFIELFLKKNYNRKSSESSQEKWVYTTNLPILGCVTWNKLKNLSGHQVPLTK